MRTHTIVLAIVAAGGLAAGGYVTRGHWLPQPTPPDESPAEATGHTDEPPVRVKLSAAARANLKLVSRPAELTTYWRSLTIPGAVAERPGVSERGITAPTTCVVSQILAKPGATVRAGERLFVLKLISEAVQTAQAELFKTVREVELTGNQRAALESARGAVSELRLVELDNQIKRLTGAAQAFRQDLAARGFTPDQIAATEQGRFATEITVVAPPPAAGAIVPAASASPEADVVYEVEELRVHLGEQVQAGQTLCQLADHRHLWIEGRAFKQEAPAIARAAEERWPVRVEFTDDDPAGWPPFDGKLTISHLANSVDAISRTFGVYLPLTNPVRPFGRDGGVHLLWRFRPGQRVRLHVPVEKLESVFVLPADAVVRDGAETFVFRQNGDYFERQPVHVIHVDRTQAVIAAGGAVTPGLYIAQSSAAAINRALRASAEPGGPDHGHDH